MIPHILHFTIPPTTTAAQDRAIARAAELHPGWEIRLWRDPVPPKDMRLAIFWDRARSDAQRADLIKLDAIHNHGGVYLDTDVILCRNIDKFAESDDFFISSENGQVATDAVFGAPAQNPVTAHLIDGLIANPPEWDLSRHEATGSGYFARQLRWRQDVRILPRMSFYPASPGAGSDKPHATTYGLRLSAGSKLTGGLQELAVQSKKMQSIRSGLKSRFKQMIDSAVEIARPKLTSYSTAGNQVVRTIHGHYLILVGEDFSMTPGIFFTTYHEIGEENFVKNALQGGDYFIDIGANIGVFSILAATRVGSFGRVFAYEPSPRPADVLAKSAVMNWVHDRLVLRRAAVGSEPGRAELSVNEARLGDASMMVGATGGAYDKTRSVLGNMQSVSVDVVRLDDEFPYDVHVRVLKIDAEGFEPEVLKGADRLLRAGCIDYIIVEALQQVAGYSWTRLLKSFEGLSDLGYSPFAVGPRGDLIESNFARIRAGWQGYLCRNIIFKHNQATWPAADR